jgi:hypothetical protein
LLQALSVSDQANAEALSVHVNGEFTAVKNLLDSINGDSATEGSWRKGLADVVGMAPEAWNTLGEIAAYIEANPSAGITAAVAEQLNTALASIQATATTLTEALAVSEQRLTDESVNRSTALAALASSAVLIKSESLVVIEESLDPPGYGSGRSRTVINTSFAPQNGVNGIANFGVVRYTDVNDGATYDIHVTPVADDTTGKRYEVAAAGLALVGKIVQIQYWHIAG